MRLRQAFFGLIGTGSVAGVWLMWVLLPHSASQASDSALPNILWITVEDMSPQLGCYGDQDAHTPQLDHLATQSVRYTKAFATAPVCSPARSCLITGMYATSLGTQRLRSEFPLPDWVEPFTQALRQAGYFTSNNFKTDYNVAHERDLIQRAWDRNGEDAHWRDRSTNQPFFSVFNLMTTHQSRTSVWTHEEFERQVGSRLAPERRHDPALVTLPPYYPDTAEVRKTWARYLDCISVMDDEVGLILQQLADDGLADSTIVFFYSDHGMGLPRGKRLLHDSGLHVPLLIRFPQAFSHLAPSAPGSTTDRLVSFVDFAATVLRLAGVAVPPWMQGTPFLPADEYEPRQWVFGARDRVDEVYDLARSVRDDRYLYIRNFMPHQSWMPPEAFSDQSAMRRELFRLRDQGLLDSVQLTYAASRRSREELYDTQVDPHQVQNLVASPSHQRRLELMRERLNQWIGETRDLGFLTEPDVRQRMRDATPWDVAQNDQLYPLQRIVRAAAAVGHADALPNQVTWLGDPDAGVRYWAAVGMTAAGRDASTARRSLLKSLEDPAPWVRIEAAAALAAQGRPHEALPTLIEFAGHDDVELVLPAVRSLELMKQEARPALPTVRATLQRAIENESMTGASPLWMYVRFSTQAIVDRLDAVGEPKRE